MNFEIFPNAKINIGLNVVEKRQDGYHNLETVFYPIPLTDKIEITESVAPEIILDGIKLDGNPEENLVMKAFRLMEKEFGIPPVCIKLTKRIPFGAGLGGGSSDAAYVMKTLNEMFTVGLSEERLEELASRIGADCAFFISNKPVYATGIGNIFTPLDFSLKGWTMLLVKPDVFVSTKDAYALVKPEATEKKLYDLLQKPVSQWKTEVKNDFEKSVFAKFPVIEQVKNRLYELGADYASMSGSGSSVFGLFRNFDLDERNLFPEFFCRKLVLE